MTIRTFFALFMLISFSVEAVEQVVDIQHGTWIFQEKWVSRKRMTPVESPRFDNGIVSFRVAKGKEGKWSLDLDMEAGAYTELMVEYRARNLQSSAGDDFLFHLEGSGGKPSRRWLVQRSQLVPDWSWQTLKIKLDEFNSRTSRWRRLIVHLIGKNDGGELQLRKVMFRSRADKIAEHSDLPVIPWKGESGFELQQGMIRRFKPHPTWVGGARASEYSVGKNGIKGVSFSGNGEMKWSLPVSLSLEDYPYLVFSYRADHVNSTAGNDFFLHLDTSAAGSLRHDWAVRRDEIVSDGRWRVKVVDLRLRCGDGTINQAVFHLVSQRNCKGKIEVGELRFVSESPYAQTVGKGPHEAKQLARIVLDSTMRIGQRASCEVTWPQGDASSSWEQLGDATEFRVSHANAVTRWNVIFPNPLTFKGGEVIEIAYEAENVQENPNGVIWLGWDVVNDTVPVDLRPVRLRQFKADGLQRLACGLVPEGLKSAWSMGVLVRANGSGKARLKVSEVRIYNRMPRHTLKAQLPYVHLPYLPENFLAVPLPTCNQRHLQFKNMFHENSWFDGSLVAISGIPFRIRTSQTENNMLGTTMRGQEELSFDVGNHKISEFYVILGSRFTGDDSPTLGKGKLTTIHEPERFVVEVKKQDGQSDWYFPVNARSHRREVEKGMDVYGVRLTEPSLIRSIVLHDRMSNGSFAVAGLTLNTSAALLPAGCHDESLFLAGQDIEGRNATTVSVDLGTLTLKTATSLLQLNPKNPLEVQRFVNRQTGHAFMNGGTNCLLRLPGALSVKKVLPLEDGFRIFCEGNLFKGTVSVSVNRSLDLFEVSGDMVCRGARAQAVKAEFPAFKALELSEDSWWFYPCLGYTIGNSERQFSTRYGGMFPFQVMGFFSPEEKQDFLLLGRDVANIPKDYQLDREGKRGRLGISTAVSTYQTGQPLKLAPYSFGLSQGGWKSQAEVYRKWVAGNLRQRSAKSWLQDRFVLLEICAHHGYYQVFDAKKLAFTYDSSLNYIRQAIGGVDMLHFFDYGLTPRCRVGDYDDYSLLGGLDNLKLFIARAEADGMPTSLYVEGNLASARSRYIEKNGRTGLRLSPMGRQILYPGSSTELFMCPEATTWQNHLVGLARRLTQETGARVFYLDEFGYCGPDRNCYAKHHGHDVPGYAAVGEGQILKAISGILPQHGILSEASPNDHNLQYQDGSLSSALGDFREDGNHLRIDLYRYFFPRFKPFQLIALHQVVGDGYMPIKWAFFNGTGIMLSGDVQEDFSDNAKAYLRDMYGVLQKYRHVFASETVDVDLPGAVHGIHANAFSIPGKTIITLLNGNFRSIQGTLIRLPLPERTVAEDWQGKPIKLTRGENGLVAIEGRIGPRDVTGIVLTMSRTEQDKN